MMNKLTKRFLSALLTLCMLIGGMWIPALPIHAEEATVPSVKVYDFEADTIGAAPAGFTITGSTVQVAEESGTGNKVLSIKNPTDKKPSATVAFDEQKSVFSVEFRIKYMSESATTQHLISVQNVENSAKADNHAATLLEQDGIIKAHNGSEWKTILESYETNVWYSVKIDVDPESKLFSITIAKDGEAPKAVNDIPFRNKSVNGISYLCFSTAGKKAADMYIDDVKVPSSEAGSEPIVPPTDDPEVPPVDEPVDPPVTPPSDNPSESDGFVIDFENETVGSAPANTLITVYGANQENPTIITADPKNGDNKVLMISRPTKSAKPYTLINIPTQKGAFTVEYRIMFNGDAQYAAILQSGTENKKQGAYLLARDQEYSTNPGELLNNNGSKWNTLFSKDKFTYMEWYSVKIEVDMSKSKYDITVTDSKGASQTSVGVGFKSSGVTDLDYLNFQLAGSKPGTLYVDDIKVVTLIEEIPSDPGNTPSDPGSSEAPAMPDVAFGFDEEPVGEKSKYAELSGVDSYNTVTVTAEPNNIENNVLWMHDEVAGDTDVTTALKANFPFSDKNGTFTIGFKLKFGTKGDDYIINLLQNTDNTGNRGVRMLARDGSLRYIDGSGNWITFNEDYTVNKWYTFLIVANVSTDTYNLYVDGNLIKAGAEFESKVSKLNWIQFTTTGKLKGEMYIDDIAVEGAVTETATELSINKYTPTYMAEQLLADGSSSTYLAFPSILKLSDEKVLIAYKASTAHMDVEADLDIIVYDPTTKQVVSKTTIDGTVGEAAQNAELMQMPNGDLVIYIDVQRVEKNGQQRYGIKELRSTDGGDTWKVLAADGTYKPVDQVEKHGYKVLKDDKGITYGYTFDDVTVNGTVYMLAMSFADFGSDPGRSVHIIKSTDNGATWIHVKNLTTTFGIAFNESSLEAYDGGFIVNCRKDSDGKKGVTYRTDENFNVLAVEDYSAYSDVIKTTHRPKLFEENGRYYLMGRNLISSTLTTLGLYEIDPVTLKPLSYIELKSLPGHSSGNSFYAEYYLQEKDGVTYFNVITYDDNANKNHPDIVRYEYIWDEITSQNTEAPKWTDNAVSTQNETETSTDVVFKAPYDNEFVTKYTITLNGETVGTIDFEEITEVTGTLPDAKVNHSGQGQYYIVMPKNIPEGMKLPVIIAVHGSGRGAMDYKNTPFYAEQRDIALANGYIFAAISNGPDTWGLDDGLYNINLFYDYLIENYPVQEKAALWATSAGGTLANRMVKDYPEKVSFVIGTFPVYDLVAGFSVNSCKNAWGTTNLIAFKNLIEGKNPVDFADALKNHDYYIAQGDSDTAVPLLDHSQKMVEDVGENIHLQVIEGGVHGTKDFSFYGDIIAQAFADHPAIYTYTLNDLTAGTDYTLSVTATDADGYTTVSNTVSFKTLASGETTEDPGNSEDPDNSENTGNNGDPENPEDRKAPSGLVIGVACGAAACGIGAAAVWFFVKKKKKFN